MSIRSEPSAGTNPTYSHQLVTGGVSTCSLTHSLMTLILVRLWDTNNSPPHSSILGHLHLHLATFVSSLVSVRSFCLPICFFPMLILSFIHCFFHLLFLSFDFILFVPFIFVFSPPPLLSSSSSKIPAAPLLLG